MAVIGVYLVSQSGMKDAFQSNVGNAKAVLTDMNIEYGLATGLSSFEAEGPRMDPNSPLPGQNDPAIP